MTTSKVGGGEPEEGVTESCCWRQSRMADLTTESAGTKGGMVCMEANTRRGSELRRGAVWQAVMAASRSHGGREVM